MRTTFAFEPLRNSANSKNIRTQRETITPDQLVEIDLTAVIGAADTA